MLTEKQIIAICEKGVVIKMRRKAPDKNTKGEYNPQTLEAQIMVPNIISTEDRDITILHELIHARDDTRSRRNGKSSDYEDSVEREAIDTYKKRPYVMELVKQLYNIK